MSFVFTPEDLTLFAAASGDRNPLHLSVEYTRATSFGQPVVFGVLGVFSVLGSLDPDVQRRICHVTADFARPAFCGVNYTIQIEPAAKPGTVEARLLDGDVSIAHVTLGLRAEAPTFGDKPTGPASFGRSEAAGLTWSDIRSEHEVKGEYLPESESAAQLAERWGAHYCSPALLETLLWSSYLVGMELPGRQALFLRLSIEILQPGVSGLSQYRARVIQRDHGAERLRIDATLETHTGIPIAEGKLVSFVRRKMEARTPKQSGHRRWIDRTALVVGGSRGLGAALAGALASEGAHVIATSRSGELPVLLQIPGIEAHKLDATNASDLRRWAENFKAQGTSLDLLVCCAFPPLQSMRLHPNSLERLSQYISLATEMAIQPLAAVLPLLSRSGGTALLISSSAVEAPVRDWPHYIAAKRAAESVFEIAALQCPSIRSVIARPESMLTEMTNTPSARRRAEDPIVIAEHLLHVLAEEQAAGTCRLLTAAQLAISPEAALV